MVQRVSGKLWFRSESSLNWDVSPNYNDSVLSYLNLYIESTDTTNDPGDYWQICIDTTGNRSSTPQTDDYRIDITGHNTVTWYKGNGTGWVVTTAPTAVVHRWVGTYWTAVSMPTAVTLDWNNSLAASNKSSVPHWTCEVRLNLTNLYLRDDVVVRVAYFDSSNPSIGVQAWPASSVDSPQDWGAIPTSLVLM